MGQKSTTPATVQEYYNQHFAQTGRQFLKHYDNERLHKKIYGVCLIS